MPIVISTLACLRGTSAMRCCPGFFMGIVSLRFERPAHPIYRYLSVLDGCIVDLALIEKAVTSRLAAITWPETRFYVQGELDL
jgi:hypothetical protein